MSITTFLERYPIFQNFGKSDGWRFYGVGESFEYPQSVRDLELFDVNAIFMELFMRKCLCMKYNIPCSDEFTETYLNYHSHLVGAYNDYKDLQKHPINIIEQIKMLALRDRPDYLEVKASNLREIMKLVDTLPYKKFAYKERLHLEIYNLRLTGSPDYIFNDSVIFHCATSYMDETSKKAQVYLYMLSHYDQHYYQENMEKTYEIIIYNPLRGKQHVLWETMEPEQHVENMEYLGVTVFESTN